MSLTTLIHDSLINLHETGGVSLDIINNCLVKPHNYWMFPKYPSKTLIIPTTANIKRETLAFINKNKTFLNEPGCMLGIWINPKTNEYYLDITTTRESKEQALDDARQYSIEQGRNIVAIYNPLIDQTIYL